MSARYFVAMLLCGLTAKLSSQPANIQIGYPSNWPNEPSACMNPVNPDEIVIGAVPDNCYSSSDGGLTWQHTQIMSSYGVNGDPVILADTSGHFYYFHLVSDLGRIVCHKKSAILAPWSEISYTANYSDYDIDKEWAAWDPVSNNIYAVWTRFNSWGSASPSDSTDIIFSASMDGGITWGEQKLISNIGGNATGGFGSVHGAYITTGPSGEIYIAWWSPEGMMFDKSTDGGMTWLSTDINITGFPVSWITSLPGIQTGVSFPVIACDRSSGSYHGNIYVTWTDKRSGWNDADIWLAKSEDGGNTWSEPKRVNNDGAGRHQFFNYIAVDEVTGKLYVIFYDRRNYTDARTEVCLAISENGGETFSNHIISETPFIPYSTLFFGHYINVCARNDQVFASWMRMDDGDLSLWGAQINPAIVGQEENKSIPASMIQNIPNPFHESTFFSFKLDENSRVTLTVTDLYGKTVATLINHERMSSGKHVVHFSPAQFSLPSGVYHYSLVTDQKTVTRKMIHAR